MAGMSKTNVTGRKDKFSTQKTRVLNGKPVKPVLYVGTWVGRGKYMAGAVDDTLVLDANNEPIPLRQIGSLVSNFVPGAA